MVSRVLGQIRLHLGRELGLMNESAWRFLWVTDFPLLEWGEEEERWVARHHPFTSPTAESEPLLESNPGAVLAQAYDLVCNGVEIGGGSIRIHRPELQERMFHTLRISQEEQRDRFGFLLDALAMGAPPHGGIAFGIDRMTMLLTGEGNLRDVIPFPKNQAGLDPMTGAPSTVEPRQLDELGIRLKPTQ